jgi:hypothetical protein
MTTKIPIQLIEIVSKLKDKTKSELEKLYTRDTVLSNLELETLYWNVKVNVIEPFHKVLNEINEFIPEEASKILNSAKRVFPEISLDNLNDLFLYQNQYFDYYHVIKTEEELMYEFNRVNKLVHHNGIELPIVVEFDYQFYNKDSFFQRPIFYSYFSSRTTTKFSKGAYRIAFPATQKYLNDEELACVLKKEFLLILNGYMIPDKDKPIEERKQIENAFIEKNLNKNELATLLIVNKKLNKY